MKIYSNNNPFLPTLSTRYGKVIAIVGMNPKKKYLVSPEERAELLRVMLQGGPDTAGVSVEGRSLHHKHAMS